MAPAYMDPKKIAFITLHCAATPRGRDVEAATVGAWDTAKFGQISYHYVIELDGSVVPTLRHDQKGAHVALHNSGNLGICYVGGVEADGTPADTRTDAQKAATAALLRQLRIDHPTARILGHRDWPHVNKACPSFDVATWLKSAGIH